MDTTSLRTTLQAFGGNEKIHIEDNATVYFDRNVTMEKCTVRASANFQFLHRKAAPASNFEECLFTICAAMWSGIEVSANSFVNLDDTEFWYARAALFFKKDFNTYKTLIRNCTFMNNVTGLSVGKIQDAANDNTIFTPQQFHDNLFEGGDLASPLTGQKSYSGISLYKCAFAFMGISGENPFYRPDRNCL